VGVHAFVCGVSYYKNLPGKDPANERVGMTFGLNQLEGAAMAAYRVYQWLWNSHQAEHLWLTSCRLLLSPSKREKESVELAGAAVQPCNFDNLKKFAAEWRRNACRSPNDQTFFYFAGHGVEYTRNDSWLLLEDFGQADGGPLENCIASLNLYGGMAGTGAFAQIAQTQFYFYDACRAFPDDLRGFQAEKPSAVWPVPLLDNQTDMRSGGNFYATASGGRTAFVENRSVFGATLLKALSGGAAGPPSKSTGGCWAITGKSIFETFTECCAEVCDEMGIGTDPSKAWRLSSGSDGGSPLVTLNEPPSVNLRLNVEPTLAIGKVKVVLKDQKTKKSRTIEPCAAEEKLRIPAGYWEFSGEPNGAQDGLQAALPETELVKPPRHERQMDFA
jgi:hypothetical protein